jgi:hypothetical protein
MRSWWHLGILLAALGCSSEEAKDGPDGSEGCDCYGNDSCNTGLLCRTGRCEFGGGGTSSAGSGSGGTSGQSGASGASSGGSGGSIQGRGYIRYTVDGTMVEVEPYLVIFGGDILDIISHELLTDSPSLRVIIGWGLPPSPGTYACADEPLQPDSTSMDYGTINVAVWHGHIKEGSCDVVLATVTPTNPISGEATGTFSGALYHSGDEPPKTVSNGSFHVRYEPPQ